MGVEDLKKREQWPAMAGFCLPERSKLHPGPEGWAVLSPLR